MIYLSGAVNPTLLRHAHRPELGMLAQPRTLRYLQHAGAFGHWAFDNDCFAQGETFDAAAWFRMVLDLPAGALFVTAPDVVGDCVATWQRSAPWLGRIRRAGHRAALVAQNGIEHSRIEWNGFDVLFIGGSDEWKMSPAVLDLLAEARSRGKATHVGRVNSEKRYRHFDGHADSADGTFLAFGPDANMARLLKWIDPERRAAALNAA